MSQPGTFIMAHKSLIPMDLLFTENFTYGVPINQPPFPIWIAIFAIFLTFVIVYWQHYKAIAIKKKIQITSLAFAVLMLIIGSLQFFHVENITIKDKDTAQINYGLGNYKNLYKNDFSYWEYKYFERLRLKTAISDHKTETICELKLIGKESNRNITLSLSNKFCEEFKKRLEAHKK